MPFSLVVKHPGIILDACSAIVVHASDRFSEVIAALPVQVSIPEYILTEELGTLDLRLPIAAGMLTKLDLEGDEEALSALHFGTDPRMHAGEAVCVALAVHRNLAVATDDASAISFLNERLPSIQVITSAEIVRNWADSANPVDVSDAINQIYKNDGYVPHVWHPLRSWWMGQR